MSRPDLTAASTVTRVSLWRDGPRGRYVRTFATRRADGRTEQHGGGLVVIRDDVVLEAEPIVNYLGPRVLLGGGHTDALLLPADVPVRIREGWPERWRTLSGSFRLAVLFGPDVY